MELSKRHLDGLFGGNIPTAQVLQGVAAGLADCGVTVIIDPRITVPKADTFNKRIMLPAHVIGEKALLIVSWHVDHESGHIIYTPPLEPMLRKWDTNSKMLTVCKKKGYNGLPSMFLEAAKLFWNFCEDPRVEHLMLQRFPGSKKHFIGGPIAAGLDKMVETYLEKATEVATQRGVPLHKAISPFYAGQMHAYTILGGFHGQKPKNYVRKAMPDGTQWVLDIVDDELGGISRVHNCTFEELTDSTDTIVAKILEKVLPDYQPPPPAPPQQSDDKSDEDEEGEEGEEGEGGSGGGDPGEGEKDPDDQGGSDPFNDEFEQGEGTEQQSQPEDSDDEDSGSDGDEQEGGSEADEDAEEGDGGDEEREGSEGAGKQGEDNEEDEDGSSGSGDSEGDSDESDSDETDESEGEPGGGDGDSGSGSGKSDDSSSDDSESDGSESGDSDEGDADSGDEAGDDGESSSGSEDEEGDDEGDDNESDDSSEGAGDGDVDEKDSEPGNDTEDCPYEEVNGEAQIPKMLQEWIEDAGTDIAEMIAAAADDSESGKEGGGSDDEHDSNLSGSPYGMEHAKDMVGMPDEYFRKMRPGVRDIVIAGQDLTKIMQGESESFQQYDNDIRGLMPKDLGPAARAFVGKFKSAPGNSYVGSRVNPRMLQPILAGKAAGRKLFTKRMEPTQSRKGVCVMIAVDCSGSMCSGVSGLTTSQRSKFAVSHAAARSLARLLQNLHIPFSMVGFTATNSASCGIGGDEHYSNSRRVDIVNFLFKDFDEPWSATEQKMLAMNPGTRTTFKGKSIRPHTNSDGESLIWAATRILPREEDSKIMIVISDGLPYGGDQQMQSKFLKWAVYRILKAGIMIGGLGLGCDAVKNYYPFHEIIREFPEGQGTDITAPLFIQEKLIGLIDAMTGGRA